MGHLCPFIFTDFQTNLIDCIFKTILSRQNNSHLIINYPVFSILNLNLPYYMLVLQKLLGWLWWSVETIKWHSHPSSGSCSHWSSLRRLPKKNPHPYQLLLHFENKYLSNNSVMYQHPIWTRYSVCKNNFLQLIVYKLIERFSKVKG